MLANTRPLYIYMYVCLYFCFYIIVHGSVRERKTVEKHHYFRPCVRVFETTFGLFKFLIYYFFLFIFTLCYKSEARSIFDTYVHKSYRKFRITTITNLFVLYTAACTRRCSRLGFGFDGS